MERFIRADEMMRVFNAFVPGFSGTPLLGEALFVGQLSVLRAEKFGIVIARSNLGIVDYHGSAPGVLVLGLRQGHASFSSSSLAAELGQDEFVVVDLSTDFSLQGRGLHEIIVLHLPYFPASSRMSMGSVLLRAGVDAIVMRDIMFQLAADGWSHARSLEEEHAIRATLETLLGAALASDAGKVLEAAGASMSDRAEEVIRANLASVRLTPDFVAQRLGISRRQLYRLYEDQQGGISQRIRKLRLECMARDLDNPLMDGIPVAELAHRWGLNDAANLSKVFRRQFGCSPREYRQLRNQLSGSRPDCSSDSPEDLHHISA